MKPVPQASAFGPPLVLAVLVLTAGCSTGANPDSATGADGTSGSLTSVAPPEQTTSCHCVPGGPRFELHDIYDGSITVTVVNITSEAHAVVAERTYASQNGWHDFGPVTRYGSDYRVIIHVDGTEKWNETVSRAEDYEVRVTKNGTVTVVSRGGV